MSKQVFYPLAVTIPGDDVAFVVQLFSTEEKQVEAANAFAKLGYIAATGLPSVADPEITYSPPAEAHLVFSSYLGNLTVEPV